MADLPPCKLAFNCVGGDSATEIARALAPNGTMVTYGGMSKRPTVIPLDVITYKQLKLKGFWITAWNAASSTEERLAMINTIADMIRSDKLTFFYQLHDFDDFEYALQKSMEPHTLRKVVLSMAHPDRFKEHDAMSSEKYEVFDAPTAY